jgi:uncharacterized small protein (DUF1192 family)
MNTSLEKVLQIVGELQVRVRILEEENAYLKNQLNIKLENSVKTDEKVLKS